MKSRNFCKWGLVWLLLWCLGSVQAGQRVALVIGNAAYQGEKSLRNPGNDAQDVAAALQQAGLQVRRHTNLGRSEMNRAIDEFMHAAEGAELAVVYYSGHGMQANGEAYLIPVDAKIKNERDVRNESIRLADLMDDLEIKRIGNTLLIIDACRDNPYRSRTKGGVKGLARPKEMNGAFLVAYATADGTTADDGDTRNGLYTEQLLKQLGQSGKSLRDVVEDTQLAVEKISNGAQRPKNYGDTAKFRSITLQGGTQLASLQAEPVVRIAAPQPSPSSLSAPARNQDAETQFWQEVKSSNSRDYVEAYIKQYPKGKYLALAKVELKRLDDAQRAERARQEAQQQRALEQERQSALRAEQASWEAAKAGNTPESYASYLASYPAGNFASLAEAAQQRLQRDAAYQAEAQAWKQAETATNSATVQAYVSRYPNGRYQSQAQIKLAALQKEEAEMRPGKVFKDCADCPEMVVVPAGNFTMGSIENADENPPHSVNIKSFAIGKYEVTQGQWKAVMGSNPSHFGNCGDNCPVEKVSWNDAKDFIQMLNAKTGKSYSLPSESEWEFACRAGGGHRYCGSDNVDAVGWHNGNSANSTHPVGQKQANAYGLYDMSGNVWEWIEDIWHGNYAGAPTDGNVWVSGDEQSQRVRRGGSWVNVTVSLRSADRDRYAPDYRINYIGFRIARTL